MNHTDIESFLAGFVGDEPASSVLDVVLALYECPQRSYHTFKHVKAMLNYAEQLNWRLLPEETLAILFHDCVYQPNFNANESYSAGVMQQFMLPMLLRDQGYEQHKAQLHLAMQIVMDTAHFLAPEKAEVFSRRVMDLDLLSLGDPDYELWKHDRVNIEKELGCTPKDTCGFFKLLLEREVIYFTEGLGEWERRARSYMTAYIEEHGDG